VAITLFYNLLMKNKEWDVVHAEQQQAKCWAVKVMAVAAAEVVTG
jgi:hypothetical protein